MAISSRGNFLKITAAKDRGKKYGSDLTPDEKLKRFARKYSEICFFGEQSGEGLKSSLGTPAKKLLLFTVEGKTLGLTASEVKKLTNLGVQASYPTLKKAKRGLGGLL